MQRIASMVQHLRDYPLLPPDLSDESRARSFRDMQSGVRLPLLHCGFKGCTWQCSRQAEVKWHWALEFELSRHLQEVHRNDEMQSVPESAWHRPGQVHYQMDAYAYYCAAVLKKEEEHAPLLGVSVDLQPVACHWHVRDVPAKESISDSFAGARHALYRCWQCRNCILRFAFAGAGVREAPM